MPRISEKDNRVNAERASGALIATANSLIGAGLGDECRMNKLERQSIEESLSNILERMEPAALDAVSQWTDPLVLVMGLISWGSRVAKILQARDAAQAEEQPQPEEQQPVASYGPGGVPSAEAISRALGGA